MKGKKYVYDKVTKKMVTHEGFVKRSGVVNAPAVVENSRKMHSKMFNRMGGKARG